MLFYTPALIVSSTTAPKNQEHFSRTLNAFPFLTGLFLSTPALLLQRTAHEILYPATSVVTALSNLEAGCRPGAADLKSSTVTLLLASAAPNPAQGAVPSYLLALIPLANFLLLLIFLKFGRWYIIGGVTATLVILAVYLPGVYARVLDIFLLPGLLFCLWVPVEILFIIIPTILYCGWYDLNEEHTLNNGAPSDFLIFFHWLNRMERNGASARLLASDRVVDVLFSVGMLLSYFLV